MKVFSVFSVDKLKLLNYILLKEKCLKLQKSLEHMIVYELGVKK